MPLEDNNVKLQAFKSINDQTRSTNVGDSAPCNDINRSTIRCWNVIIEPTMILGMICELSFTSLLSQYLYFAIGERSNLTAVIEAEKGNMTGGWDGENEQCREGEREPNSTAYHLQQQTQAESAIFLLYLELITGLPGFFVILFYGK